MEDFNYTLTPVSLPLVVHCTRFRMDSQGSLPMQARECQRQLINIMTFSHLLKKVDFDIVVDHLAIMHIMRSKAEPATTRIKRLVELLSPYSFNLYYIKRKDMVLSDLLSRQKTDDSNPHEIIPISFTLKGLSHEHFHQFNNMTGISETETNKYLIQTRSQVKSSSIKVPEIHGINKGLNPHVKPERQRLLLSLPTHSTPPTNLAQPFDKGPPTHPVPKPRIGQGRAGIKRKIRTNQPIPLPKQMLAQPIPTPAPKEAPSLPEPIVQSQESVQPQHHIPIPLPHHQPVDPTCFTQPIGPKIQPRPIPPYHDPYARPPPRPPDITNSINNWKDLLDTDTDRNVDIEENLPFQEGIISETYERQDRSYVQEPYELKDLIDSTKLVQKFLPKQMDIDKVLDIIKRKVLKGTHVPLTIKEIQVGYLSSPSFKDLYLFLSQNKLPSKRSTIKKVETLAENVVLLDSLLLKLVTTTEKETALLAIPEMCVDKIIALYHACLFAGHQGVVKTYLTMKDKFFNPGMMHYLRSFIKGCHICD